MQEVYTIEYCEILYPYPWVVGTQDGEIIKQCMTFEEAEEVLAKHRNKE